MLAAALSLAAHPCQQCHPKETAGYTHSAMARSLRRADKEPAGSFVAGGTKFTVRADSAGTWQRLDRGGESSEFRVGYVIGSGNHASGYLIQIGDHLFQSPVCYYPARKGYDLAPGYEKLADPDFTRPVTEACLLCHSGAPLHVAGSLNRYAPPVFAEESISCERCHGPSAEHIRNPVRGTIVNPAKLPAPARDSVCEQCHLAGVARVLNPGKSFSDFHPGQRLEEVFAIYVNAAKGAGAFKVISHAEQLALSACARASQGKLWCGTCHNPHDKPTQPAPYYRSRCLSCHRKLEPSHPAAASDCVGCHMPRRQARDGGHSAFTDHRIARHPQPEINDPPPETDLAAWREPDPGLAQRNLGLAYVNAGVEHRSPRWLTRGYRMLAEVQKSFPDDLDVLNGLGTALLLARQPAEAQFAFERALRLAPDNPAGEQNVATAWIAAGEPDKAIPHLERCLELDPLLLPAATTLMGLYRQRGDLDKESALAGKLRSALRSAPPADSPTTRPASAH